MKHIKIAQTCCRNIAALFVVVPLVSCTLGGTALPSITPPAISSTSPADSAAGGAVNNTQDDMAGHDMHAATRSDTVSSPGFSFTRVTGGCVLDNVTGLMWEVKTADGGLRDWQKKFTNFDSTTELQQLDTEKHVLTHITPTQAEIDAPTNSVGYRNRVNAQSLCSYSDWRMPGIDEFQTIINFNANYPPRFVGDSFLDNNWFPNTVPSNTWSATPAAGVPETAWYIMLNEGAVYTEIRRAPGFVRLVRTNR